MSKKRRHMLTEKRLFKKFALSMETECVQITYIELIKTATFCPLRSRLGWLEGGARWSLKICDSGAASESSQVNRNTHLNKL